MIDDSARDSDTDLRTSNNAVETSLPHKKLRVGAGHVAREELRTSATKDGELSSMFLLVTG